MQYLKLYKKEILVGIGAASFLILYLTGGMIVAQNEVETNIIKKLNLNNELHIVKQTEVNPISIKAVQMLQVYTVEAEPTEYIDDFTPRDDIPLDEDLQRYIWELCEKYQLSETLVYAIIKVESNFDDGAKSDTNDTGLMQLNQNGTSQWLAQELGIDDFDPQNPFHNVEAGIYYLNFLKQYYLTEGYNEEDVTERVLLAYNMGQSGSERYLKRTGQLTSSYSNKVLLEKYKMEGDSR